MLLGWKSKRTVYHNGQSAALLSAFGFGRVRQYTPFTLSLSALHPDHSDAPLVLRHLGREDTKQRNKRTEERGQKLNCNRLTLVTFEEHETIEEDGCTIHIVPATEWLLAR